MATVFAPCMVQAYARIKECNFDQAFAIAHIILDRADNDDKPKKKDDITYDAAGKGLLDFPEYLMASEGGAMIPFERYLQIAPSLAKIRPDIDRADCEQKFLAARAKAFPNVEWAHESSSSDAYASSVATAPQARR